MSNWPFVDQVPSPDQWPGYWMHEQSGVLRPVMETYLNGHRLSKSQLTLMRLYLEQWIDAPGWAENPNAGEDGLNELAELRRNAHAIGTQEDVDKWLEKANSIGIDPL